MFDTSVKTFSEGRTVPILDDDLQVTFDTGDVNEDAAQKAVTFSRKPDYLVGNLTSGAAKLIVRQNFESNGFGTGDFCIRSSHSRMQPGMFHF